MPSEPARAAHTSAQLAMEVPQPSFSYSQHTLLPCSVLKINQPNGAQTIKPSTEVRSQQALLTLLGARAVVSLAPSISLVGRKDAPGACHRPRLRREIGWIKRRGRHNSAVGNRLIALLSVGQEARAEAHPNLSC
jgi:hypothetical protein